MATSTYPILAREGWPFIAIASVVALLTSFFWGWWALPCWIIWLFVVQFFRDPPRRISSDEAAVVAPASGKVVAIETVDNPYIEGMKCTKVSIFMNVFSVHSNLSPVAGTIENCDYFRGSFLNAALDKASKENERNAVWVKTDKGHDVVFVQIAGLVARRILCYVKPGERIAKGQRYGFIRFGSRVDVYLPTSTRLTVKLGQAVASGNDVIAELANNDSAQD